MFIFIEGRGKCGCTGLLRYRSTQGVRFVIKHSRDLPLLKHFVTVCHQHTPTKEESASDKAGGEPCIPSLIWRINGEVRNTTCLNSELAVSELMRLGHSIGWAPT
jgi:hypothetical protein